MECDRGAEADLQQPHRMMLQMRVNGLKKSESTDAKAGTRREARTAAHPPRPLAASPALFYPAALSFPLSARVASHRTARKIVTRRAGELTPKTNATSRASPVFATTLLSPAIVRTQPT